ncbi:nuclease homologue [Onishia taeanensis]|uniref:Nuclease homologue n=1 Tax=Onishia taeanensis TaxID=284577 RepID=A0A1G7NIC7_9GAMM|nr:thermonuclease family protein [Halomonas taeanensis]SDF73000.1 nuclease homologue [Halomonas taeanensis]
MIRTFIAALTLAPSLALAEYGSADVDRVTSIYDGDTFRADIAGWPDVIGERIPVRVAGVDTPEIRGSCEAEKRAARRAKQFTVARLREANSITLEEIERGKYFRVVAHVIVDGKDLGEMLIDEGMGVHYGGGTKSTWCG